MPTAHTRYIVIPKDTTVEVTSEAAGAAAGNTLTIQGQGNTHASLEGGKVQISGGVNDGYGNGGEVVLRVNGDDILTIIANKTDQHIRLDNIATATSATAGGNGDVPSQVVGYLRISIGGTRVKIPYYAD